MFGPSRRELLRLLERERKAHRAELANLLDRLASQTGRPWTPAPADMTERVETEQAERAWFASPEQEPIQ